MNAATTTYGSILEKPLKQLTEEDISQLTREDCRKYLKDKGMRRPSWNKSQAIQQVISLKALLEPCDDDDVSATHNLRRRVVPPQSQPGHVPSNSVDSVEEPSPDVQVSVSAEEPHGTMDPPKLGPSGEPPCVDTDNNAISPRSPCATNGSVGQMTIFYCGKVNVYEGVPPDKAQAIMKLASSPVHLPQDDTIGRPGGLWSFPYHLPSPNDKDHPIPPSTTISQMMQTEKMTEYSQQYREKGNITRDPDVEGQANRKVSLQRYLEKRKDRGRLKSKKSTGLPSSSLEMYLNHPVRTNTPNGNSSRSSTSSPPQHGLPPALSNSSNNQPKSAGLAVDLNDKAIAAYRVRWQPKRSDRKSWVSWSCALHMTLGHLSLLFSCHLTLYAAIAVYKMLKNREPYLDGHFAKHQRRERGSQLVSLIQACILLDLGWLCGQ